MFDIDVSQYGAENQQVVRVRYLYPADHPFAHGQLYTTLSRVPKREDCLL